MEEPNHTNELIDTLKKHVDVLNTENQRLFAEVQRLRDDNAELMRFIRLHPAAIIVQSVYDAVTHAR